MLGEHILGIARGRLAPHRGAGEAKEMRGPGNHKRQPECSVTIPPVIGCIVTRAKPTVRIMAAKAWGLGKRRIDSTR